MVQVTLERGDGLVISLSRPDTIPARQDARRFAIAETLEWQRRRNEEAMRRPAPATYPKCP
jgi:hypothetical protein